MPSRIKKMCMIYFQVINKSFVPRTTEWSPCIPCIPIRTWKLLLLKVSDADVVGIVTLWLEIFKYLHFGHHVPKENLYATYQLIPVWVGWAMHPNGNLLEAISSCATVSSFKGIHKKITLAVWRRIPHITSLLYKVYLPITDGFVELKHYVSYTNSWVLVIGTNIHPCEWGKETFVCSCNRQICNIPRQKQSYFSV